MDKYNLQRFKEQQQIFYRIALKEIRNGKKNGHWIWFIFPQMDGLAEDPSERTKYFSFKSLDEAKAYYCDKDLNSRLREITTELLSHCYKNINNIVGEIDADKIKSCMTLFDYISPNDIFEKVLKHFYNNNKCEGTLKIINA